MDILVLVPNRPLTVNNSIDLLGLSSYYLVLVRVREVSPGTNPSTQCCGVFTGIIISVIEGSLTLFCSPTVDTLLFLTTYDSLESDLVK